MKFAAVIKRIQTDAQCMKALKNACGMMFIYILCVCSAVLLCVAVLHCFSIGLGAEDFFEFGPTMTPLLLTGQHTS